MLETILKILLGFVCIFLIGVIGLGIIWIIKWIIVILFILFMVWILCKIAYRIGDKIITHKK